jgi:hypothetical protein
MKELINVRQIQGEPKRRWFYSEQFDLIVWYNNDELPSGFELCYDKIAKEKSIVWHASGGFAHMAVDGGESRTGRPKASPVLVPDGFFDAKRLYSAFTRESQLLPGDVAALVLTVIKAHPNYEAAL